MSDPTKVPDVGGLDVGDTSATGLRRFMASVRELLQVREGRRGQVLDKSVVWRDLVAAGFASEVPGGLLVPGSPPVFPLPGIGGPTDRTPPPAATNLAVTPGFSTLFVEWDANTYTTGGGNAYTEVWGAPYVSGPLPVFSAATLLSKEEANFFAFPAGPSRTWHFWLVNVSRANVPQTVPTGGTNGVSATTGRDVRALLDALSAAATDPALPYSRIAFRSDFFYIAPECDFNQEATPTGTVVGQLWFKPSTGITKTWDGAAWQPFSVPLPFLVSTAPTTINGVTIPAGVYMDSAFIYDLTASIARLGNAWIDDAKIANLSAAKLLAGSLQVGSYIRSTSYVGGSGGWTINANGSAEFNSVTVRGTIYASAGEIGGAAIAAGYVQSSNYVANTAGWKLTNAGGLIEANAGKIGGATIAATYVESTNYVPGTSGWRLDNASGIIYAVNIDLSGATDVVATPNIQQDSAVVAEFASASYTVGATTSDVVVLTSASIDPGSAGHCILTLAADYTNGYGGSGEQDWATYVAPTFKLKRNGTTIATWTPEVGFGASRANTAYTYKDVPGSAAVYTLTIVAAAATSVATIGRRTLSIVGHKKST